MTVEDYMALPYSRIIMKRADGDGVRFFGRILEFDGCMTDGETLEELEANLNEVMEMWLEVQLEDNEVIPEPVSRYAFHKLGV